MTNQEMLRELRNITFAGMKDCSEALKACDFDLDKAIDMVKAKGLSNTSRTSAKVAAEGKVFDYTSYGDGVRHTLVEINSNTDFISGSPEFKDFGDKVAAYIVCNPLFSGDLNHHLTFGDEKTLEQQRLELMAKTKENIVVRRWASLETTQSNQTIVHYLHPNAKIGVLLSLQAETKEALGTTDFKEFAENTAMQIAAMSPIAISRVLLPKEEIERQRAIFEAQLKDLKKPEAAWAKIIEGKFNKWYSDVCLLDQESVIVPKTSIQALMSKLNGISILSFVRFQVGENIEVKKDNFAEEVEKLSGISQDYPKGTDPKYSVDALK